MTISNVEMDSFETRRPYRTSLGSNGKGLCGCRCVMLGVVLIGGGLTLWGAWRVETNIAEYCSFEHLTINRSTTTGALDNGSAAINNVFELSNVSLSKRDYCYFKAWTTGCLNFKVNLFWFIFNLK